MQLLARGGGLGGRGGEGGCGGNGEGGGGGARVYQEGLVALAVAVAFGPACQQPDVHSTAQVRSTQHRPSTAQTLSGQVILPHKTG